MLIKYISVFKQPNYFISRNVNLVAYKQNGITGSRSCKDHVFSLATIIQNRLYTSKETFVAFVDFSKAFDSVDRTILLHKLLNYHINGKHYMAIKIVL